MSEVRTPINPDEIGLLTDSEDEVEAEHSDEVQNNLQLQRSPDDATCIYPVEGRTMRSNEVLNIAPGEG